MNSEKRKKLFNDDEKSSYTEDALIIESKVSDFLMKIFRDNKEFCPREIEYIIMQSAMMAACEFRLSLFCDRQ